MHIHLLSRLHVVLRPLDNLVDLQGEQTHLYEDFVRVGLIEEDADMRQEVSAHESIEVVLESSIELCHDRPLEV